VILVLISDVLGYESESEDNAREI